MSLQVNHPKVTSFQEVRAKDIYGIRLQNTSDLATRCHCGNIENQQAQVIAQKVKELFIKHKKQLSAIHLAEGKNLHFQITRREIRILSDEKTLIKIKDDGELIENFIKDVTDVRCRCSQENEPQKIPKPSSRIDNPNHSSSDLSIIEIVEKRDESNPAFAQALKQEEDLSLSRDADENGQEDVQLSFDLFTRATSLNRNSSLRAELTDSEAPAISKASDRAYDTIQKPKKRGFLRNLLHRILNCFKRNPTTHSKPTPLLHRKLSVKEKTTTESPQFSESEIVVEPRIYDDAQQYIDPFKLLINSSKPNAEQSPANKREWELNCGLLYSIYQRTEDESTKRLIRFLILNYLAKAAYLNPTAGKGIDFSPEQQAQYKELLQIGEFTYAGDYHREGEVPLFDILQLEKMVGSREDKAKDLTPLDTMEVEELFCISFTPTPDITEREAIAEIMAEQFDRNIANFSENKNMEAPILIDVTQQMGQLAITDNEQHRIDAYQAEKQHIKTEVNEILGIAIEKIKARHPDKSEEEIVDYLRTNTIVVSRARVNDYLCVLLSYPNLFTNDFHNARKGSEREIFVHEKVHLWAKYASTNAGAVSYRMMLAHRYENFDDSALLPKIEYAVEGRADSLSIYESPQTLLETNSFSMLRRIGEDIRRTGNAQQFMAKATVRMIETLIDRIQDPTTLKDPAAYELIQTTLFRIQQHIATATHHVDDFRRFSQAIDLVHTELTTLLAFSPFNPEEFETLYEMYLAQILPDSNRVVAVGIARSAMNVFSGINAAIIQNNPNPVRICGAHSYYEEAGLIGGSLTLDQALNNPDIEKVDLYVAEFNHNIDIDPNHTRYQKGSVIQDIRQIFEQKPDTDSLTVAIDATIDHINSEDIKALLTAFKDEIAAGKLNIVVFRSGQKFDMLGMDNYYGSPFYIINNGDPKWNLFQRIKTNEAYQTDPFSLQFFTWMAATGPELVDEYKTLIFENTQAILECVPESLRPTPEKRACVCTFDEGVKTPFIDIKISKKEGDSEQTRAKRTELHRWVQTRFMELFIEKDKLVYRRGSFGFPHPNLTWIDPKIRINPGIDPDDIPLYEQFFQEFEAKAAEYNAL